MTALSLIVETPLERVVEVSGVASLRGEDASGGFGILPGHADFVTVIDAGVLRWRGTANPWRFCVLRGGVFSMTGGQAVHVACREAITGDDLANLQVEVRRARAEIEDAARKARTDSAKLHARAIRRLMRGLALGPDSLAGELVHLDGEDAP
ncbi:F0F1 ATP synthase subunit epsilon [Sagittula salina]|uniref:ATP synthase epsilon chain n=1 Tax=Sagittula salina TaxID=2820268 RepID=A0A940MP50_9RHOB|nr:F0F1 ATP synthase subunit epsilon [Sagittula salina]MBP0485066.1 F0F1 ATP synthase subunit epsilon [Sagittula salina]